MRKFENSQQIKDSVSKSFEAFAALWNQWWQSVGQKREVSQKSAYLTIASHAKTSAILANTLVDAFRLKGEIVLEGISESLQKKCLAEKGEGSVEGITLRDATDTIAQNFKELDLKGRITEGRDTVKEMARAWSYMKQLMDKPGLVSSHAKAKIKTLENTFNGIIKDDFDIGGRGAV